MLFSLLLGVFFGFCYVLLAYCCLLFGRESPVSLEGAPKTLCLPILKERQTFQKPKESLRLYRKILAFFLDICYFFFCGTLLSIFVYSVGGVFRLSYVTLALAGAVLFSMTLGKLLLKGSPWVLLGVKILFWYCTYFFLLPIRLFFIGIKLVFRKVQLIFCSLCDKIRIEIYNRNAERSGDAFGKEWEQCIREELSVLCSEK